MPQLASRYPSFPSGGPGPHHLAFNCLYKFGPGAPFPHSQPAWTPAQPSLSALLADPREQSAPASGMGKERGFRPTVRGPPLAAPLQEVTENLEPGWLAAGAAPSSAPPVATPPLHFPRAKVLESSVWEGRGTAGKGDLGLQPSSAAAAWDQGALQQLRKIRAGEGT